MTDEKLIEEAAKAIHRVFASEWAVIASALKMDQAQYDSLLTDLARAAFAVFEKAHAPTTAAPELEVESDAPSGVAPTDDEREAMRRIIAQGSYSLTPESLPYEDVAYRLVEAGFGFRRSEVPEPSAGMIAPEDGMTLEELGNAMLSASDQWDGDESMHSIVYRFIEHYAELDAEIRDARERVDFDDDAEILFRWDWESGSLKRVEAPEPQGEPSDDGHLITDCGHGVNSLYDRCVPCEAVEQGEPTDAQMKAAWDAYITAQEADPYDREGRMRAALRAAGGVR